MISYHSYYIVENEHLYGPGKRLLLFLQGCSIHCEGCINKKLWPFLKEKTLSAEEVLAICEKEKVEGITLHGGEPLDQADGLTKIVKLLKQKRFSIILFTGYIKKELKDSQIKVWNEADMIICGRFQMNKQNFHLQFKGSTNQRVIKHKGIYKKYRVENGKTVAILTLDNLGKINIRGFYSDDIKSIIRIEE